MADKTEANTTDTRKLLIYGGLALVVAGMFAFALAVAVGLGVFFAMRDNQPSPYPGPSPQPSPAVLAQQLRGVLVGPTAADDALGYASLFDGAAYAVDWDGRQSAPVLTTAQQLGRYVDRMAALDGAWKQGHYPTLGGVLGTHLQRTMPMTGALGPVERTKAVAEFRLMADAFREVAKQ